MPAAQDNDAVAFEQAVQVYNALRDARFNLLYYGRRLALYESRNFWVEVVVALGLALGSGSLAATAWLQTEIGQYLSAFVTAVAAVLAVVKPLLKYTDQISRYSKLFVGYSLIAHNLKVLADEMRMKQEIPRDLDRRLQSAQTQLGQLVTADDAVPDDNLLDSLYDRVNRELPHTEFWYPGIARGSLA